MYAHTHHPIYHGCQKLPKVVGLDALMCMEQLPKLSDCSFFLHEERSVQAMSQYVRIHIPLPVYFWAVYVIEHGSVVCAMKSVDGPNQYLRIGIHAAVPQLCPFYNYN